MPSGFMESKCPECGTKNREVYNAWAYGSPVKVCKACRAEYLDRRFREVAIDGFDPRSNNISFYVKGALLLLAIALVSAGLLYFQMGRGYYSTKILIAAIACGLGSIACAVMALRIKLGFQDKANGKFMAESEARLRDPAYVQKLEGFGYKVPEKYKSR